MDVNNAIVTGGAGFIGSHLTEELVKINFPVKVIDNLTSGNIKNLDSCKDNKYYSFIKGDLKNSDNLKNIFTDVKTVFHMAAYPEVRTGYENPALCFSQNIENTFSLLEQIRKSNAEVIVFCSSSTIYGEPLIFPTPENYSPLEPISIYGSSKLACESLISSFCHTYGIKAQIFRFANIVGKRSNHGVIFDFIKKLSQNPNRLEILGDGRQSKSYLHVNDCVKGILLCFQKSQSPLETFNIGNEDEVDVLSIAKIVCNSMDLSNTEIFTTDKFHNGRGWIGDVKKMRLDISKIKKNGWSPKLSSKEAVELATRELIDVLELIKVGS